MVRRFECYGRTLPGVTVRVTGLTPLLMNNPESMQEGKKPPIKGTPFEQANPLVITNGAGVLAIPSFALRSSICEGASFLKSPIPKKMMKSFFYETITVLPDEWLVLTRNGEPIPNGNDEDNGWDIDGRRARVNKTGGSVWRYRPKINLPWSFEASIAWDTPDKSQGHEDFIVARFQEAVIRSGSGIGLGDFRPQNKGIFGRYSVEFI